MGKIERGFCYFSIFYLINYLWIEKYFPAVGEINLVNIIVIILLVALLINIPYIISRTVTPITLLIIVLFILTILWGFLGSTVYGYQGIKLTFTDFFLFTRFIIMFAAMSLLVVEEQKKKLLNFFILNLKGLTTINFLLLLVNIPTHIFPTFDIRFGIASQQLIYSHPTYLATISFLSWALISGENSKKYKIMALILMLTTLRTKIIILVSVFYFYRLIVKNIKSLAIKNLLSIGSIVTLGYASFSDIIYTRLINTESSVRANIMITAVKIAKDHLPFGAGFATYGSYSSFLHYSPLYGLYGLSNTYGFLKTSYQYGMDSYVSMLIAQLGFFGSFTCITMILLIIFDVINKVDLRKKIPITLISIFLIMSCFTESTLNTGIGIVIFGLLSLTRNTFENITKEDV